MDSSAWRIYWRVFFSLMLLVAGVALWWGMGDVQRSGSVLTAKGSMLPARRAQAPAASSAQYGGLIVPAGFMRAPSGKLLPRFVSLADRQVQVRLGPGEEYPLAWVIRSAGMPVEVLAEVNGWLRIRDHEGEEGWIRTRGADGEKRTALVAPWRQNARLPLHKVASDDSPLKAWLGSGVMVRLLSCDGAWCKVRAGDIEGWLRQEQLWGVYRNEHISKASG